MREGKGLGYYREYVMVFKNCMEKKFKSRRGSFVKLENLFKVRF